jgi:glycosyltransferase involved in cell wall biosynthesis
MMRVAILTTDGRDMLKAYENRLPILGTSPEALLQGFASLPEIEVHIISCLQREVSSVERLAPKIFFHALAVPKIGWLRTGYQGCIRAVRRKLRSIRPEIVHGQGTERDCAISAVFSGYPNVVTIHGNMTEIGRATNARVGSFHWLTAHLENFALKRTAGVLCNSAHTENLVKPRTSRTWRVPNPVRTAFFDTPVSARSFSKCILLNVGVISANKRQLELLDLAERLCREGLPFEIWFVGHASRGDSYAEQFLQRISMAEQHGFAHYLGLLSINDLIACYDQATALIHVPIAEAFGLVVAEALARNLKFFGSRVGGVPDITDEVKDAELFAKDDWVGLGTSISNWIKRGSPRPDEAQQQLMRDRYHPIAIAERHIEIYREVLRIS